MNELLIHGARNRLRDAERALGRVETVCQRLMSWPSAITRAQIGTDVHAGCREIAACVLDVRLAQKDVNALLVDIVDQERQLAEAAPCARQGDG